VKENKAERERHREISNTLLIDQFVMSEFVSGLPIYHSEAIHKSHFKRFATGLQCILMMLRTTT